VSTEPKENFGAFLAVFCSLEKSAAGKGDAREVPVVKSEVLRESHSAKNSGEVKEAGNKNSKWENG